MIMVNTLRNILLRTERKESDKMSRNLMYLPKVMNLVNSKL